MNEKAKGHRTQRRKQSQNHREDAQTRQILAELERQIKIVQAGGDRLSAFAGRQAKALLYYTDQKWTAAAREYDQAAQLAAAEEQPLSEAQSRLGQGLALENLLHRQEDAQTAFRQAADLYLELGKLDSMLEARQRIAALYAKAGDFGRAVEEMTDTLEHLDQAAHPRLVIAAYRSRAQFRALQANMAGEGARLALADLDEALRVAEESGDRETALEIRTQRRAGQGLLDGGGQVEDLSALLQDSLDIGRLDTLGEVHLQRAQEFSQQGQFEKVLEAAEAARQAALQSTDMNRYSRYLRACLFTAGAREALDDRPGVIAILLTCKRTLEDALGKEVGQQINRLLDSLADRWGQEGLMEALRIYRERVANKDV